MAYLVRILPRAQRDLDAIYAAINAEHSDAAFRWFDGLERAVFTLEEIAERCPVTPEDASLRHLLYGKKPHVYRVIYRVVENQNEVHTLHIRHGARQAFKADDLT
jgi:plasmid stabilization system protein ParE